MKTIAIKYDLACDRCGRKIKGDDRGCTFIPVYADSPANNMALVDQSITNFHFCQKCTKDIIMGMVEYHPETDSERKEERDTVGIAASESEPAIALYRSAKDEHESETQEERIVPDPRYCETHSQEHDDAAEDEVTEDTESEETTSLESNQEEDPEADEEDPEEETSDEECDTQETAEHSTSPERKKVDHGKICALYKANWKIKDIADDIGCSVQTVIIHLTKEGIYRSRKAAN